MLYHYSSEMTEYDGEDAIKNRKNLLIELDQEAANSKNDILVKQTMIFFLQVHMPFEDQDPLPQLQKFIADITHPSSGVPSPSYISITLKFLEIKIYWSKGEMLDQAS